MIVKRGKGDFHQAYRPYRLSEMVGNHKVKKVIEQAFKENKVPHTFLFHGLSGTGKTTLSCIIQMGLNCKEGPTSEPCCECYFCRRIIKYYGSLAVYEVNAVEVLKDQLKEMLSNFHWTRSGLIEGVGKSIFLVDECHGLAGYTTPSILPHMKLFESRRDYKRLGSSVTVINYSSYMSQSSNKLRKINSMMLSNQPSKKRIV